jgi:hypothetical protein
MGWAGVKNGALLKLIEDEGFEAFVTGDKNLENQQQLLQRPFAILVLSAVRWKTIRDHIPVISDALDAAKRGQSRKLNAVVSCRVSFGGTLRLDLPIPSPCFEQAAAR